MSDLTRAEVIEQLESLSYGNILEKKDMDALKFAIDSLKVDEAYNLMYEKVDFIEIPEGATNGDVFRLAYPNVAMVHDIREKKRLSVFADDWWNSPYRKE